MTWSLDHERGLTAVLFCVADPPVVDLRLGDTLNPLNIKEGDDVYFECSIRANPQKHRITWFHNVSLNI